MGERTGKRRKQYVDRSKRKLKTYSIHGPGHSSDECKVLGDFGAMYANSKPTKDCGNHPIPREKSNIQPENSVVDNDGVNGILLNETQQVSAAREAPDILNSDCDENDLYQVEKMCLEDTK